MPHIRRIALVGTGLIGASLGLALYANGFSGEIIGIDQSQDEGLEALRLGAVSGMAVDAAQQKSALDEADVIVLAVPVLAILDGITRLGPLLKPHQLMTDVGSTKRAIAEAAQCLCPGQFLPGHPMAGKEAGGAVLAEATLFQGAPWLYTPLHPTTAVEAEWRKWTERIGAHTSDLDPARHDELCAWVSHLPQFVSTALSALLEDTFGDAPELRAIGGRALREMTRLGSSPFSMWRDVAHTNEAAVGATLLALEQRLSHLRENLHTPQLREEFLLANRFRKHSSA
jgi:prephenate dehydrogenase